MIRGFDAQNEWLSEKNRDPLVGTIEKIMEQMSVHVKALVRSKLKHFQKCCSSLCFPTRKRPSCMGSKICFYVLRHLP